jgi:hypothetical protein
MSFFAASASSAVLTVGESAGALAISVYHCSLDRCNYLVDY